MIVNSENQENSLYVFGSDDKGEASFVFNVPWPESSVNDDSSNDDDNTTAGKKETITIIFSILGSFIVLGGIGFMVWKKKRQSTTNHSGGYQAIKNTAEDVA